MPLWRHGPPQKLLEIGLSIKVVFHAYALSQLYQTAKVNTDVAGKKAESYMRGHVGFLLEVQSHAELYAEL